MRSLPAVLVVAWLAFPALQAAQANEPLERARQMYYSAAFEEALRLLDAAFVVVTEDDRAQVQEYRAACLLALGRERDALEAMTELARLAPAVMPAELDHSPAFRTAYAAVRERVVGDLVRENYLAGKLAFETGRRDEADARFSTVVRVAEALPQSDHVADLRILASGFLKLIAAAATEARGRIYQDIDPGVIGPVVVSQAVPQPPKMRKVDFTGALWLELHISRTGDVLRASILQGIHPAYDATILEAARGWRYQPARLDSQPIEFRKLIRIDVRQGAN